MDKAFLDKLNAYANEHVDDVVEVIYAVNDGLMKTHEFIGHVQDRVDDVFQAAIDGVWKVSEVIELYADNLVVSNTMAETYGKTAPVQDVKPTHYAEGGKVYGLDDVLKEADRRDKIAWLRDPAHTPGFDFNLVDDLDKMDKATIDNIFNTFN